jgi:PAS domain S-box-containing protein
MGPPASTSFAILGIAVVLLTTGTKRTRRLVPALGIAVSLIASLSLMGYISGASPLFAIARLTDIAMQTATIVLALALSIIASVPEHEPARTLQEDSAAGLLARRSLPFIIAVPITLGWLRIYGQQVGWFDDAMGTSLRSLAIIVVFGALLWWWAAAVAKHERATRESERFQRLLAQVGEMGARLPETDELIGTICELVATEMNVSRCGYTIADHATGTFIVKKDYCGTRPSLAGVYPMSEYGSPKHFSEDAIATEDLATDPSSAEKYQKFWAPLELRSVLSIPLRRRSELAAIFWVADSKPRRWTAREIELVKLIADRVWLVIERKQAEQALRENEALLSSVLKQLPVGLGVTDTAGRWIVSNSLIDELMPKAIPSSNPEVARRWRVFNTNGKEVSSENWPGKRALRGEVVSPGVEALVKVADDNERWMRVSAGPLRDETGRIIGAIDVVEDIDQVKRAQQQIAEQARALAEAHERLREIISSALDAVITFDSHERIVLFNPAAEHMFGLGARDAEGQPIERFIPGAKYIETLARKGSEGVRVGALGAVHGRRANGQEFPLEASISQAQLGNEKLFTVILRDVTERKKAEERTGRLVAIVENSRAGIFSKTLDGVVTSWNPGAEAIFGYTAAEMIGSSISRIVPPECEDEEAMILLRLQAGDSVHRETVRLRKNGQRVPVSITCSPIKDAEGRIVGGAKIVRDITEEKETEERLREAQQKLLLHAADLEATVAERTAKLRETVNDLQSFSYSIAHDMRAPLRAMGMFAQLLQEEIAKGALSPAAKDYCARIIVGAGRLDNLIHDALNYTKAALQDIGVQPVDLAKLVRGLVDTYPNLHADKADIHLDADLPVVLGNESLLTQCFSNLLGNAVKFVAPGVRPNVRVRAEMNDGSVRICVEDNGIGIPQHAQPRLFSMFQKLDNKYEGTGIGLAIVRKVVERMGGQVGVDSAPDRGSRFWVELKLAPKDAKS